LVTELSQSLPSRSTSALRTLPKLMSRLSLITWSLALLALGAGALGYAATGEEVVRSSVPMATKPAAQPRPGMQREADLITTAGPGERLAAALLRSGVGGLDAVLAEQAAGTPAGSLKLWLGASVGDRARQLEQLEVRVGPGRRLLLIREADAFVRHDLAEAVDELPVRIRLAGGAGLAAELVQAGLPRPLRDAVLDRTVGKPVAAVDLIVAHEQAASNAQYREPLYLGLHLASGEVRRWVGEGGALRPVAGGGAIDGLLRPLPGPVTSSPGLRIHPILRYLRWHRGTDFAAPAGTPVQAALPGRVVEAGWKGGYGRTVRIVHPDGSNTLYAHLSEVAVLTGSPVSQGTIVGKVGSTGLATGPHLHFEWRRGEETLRPSFGVAPAGGTTSPVQRATLQALLGAPFRLPPERRS
jgi:murein DD-endopeptidase MepM/ murein hydrolase activator NlpD